MNADAAEPRYRAALDQDRDRFPSEAQFQHWRSHYISELERGRFIIDALRHHVPRFTPARVSVLDIGCGDAGVPIAFALAGARAAGLEPGARNLERAALRTVDHGVDMNLVGGVGEALPFEAAVFDLVILDNVLEHVMDRHATLAEIRRVLKPDGLLYLVTPKPFVLTSLAGDPHYHTPGLVLLPRPIQKALVDWRWGSGAYQVGWIPTRRWLRGALRRHGFVSLVSPRELWIRYVRDRISRPEEVRPGPKRRLAGWLRGRDGLFRNPVVRWVLDVGAGSNFFIARRTG